MKCRLIPGLMLAAAFTLTNCSEQLVSPDLENDIIVDGNIESGKPQEGVVRTPYEVYANGPSTKTISDGDSVYWIDEATAAANGLGKDAVDRVSIFSTLSTGAYQSHGSFTYAGNKRFVGELTGVLGNVNDWYCIYPYDPSNIVSTESSSDIKVRVSIGSTQESGYAQTQKAPNSNAHIAGLTCPMYSHLQDQTGAETPTFTMKHMAALLAIKIQNIAEDNTGNIVINRAEVSVPKISQSTGYADQEPVMIVGDFDVKISGNELEYVPVSGSASNRTTISLGGTNVSVAPGGTTTLYLAVRPFDAAGKTFDISINGNTKRVTMPSTMTLKPGEITTLNVPLTLTKPNETNVFGFKGGGTITHWETYNLAELVGAYNSTETMVINGEETIVYTLGTAAQTGQVKIQGTFPELLNKAPLYFYASSYGNTQGVMRLESVAVDIPLVGQISFNYDRLITMISPDRISFSGLLPLEQYEVNGIKHITFIDEGPILKEVDEDAIQSLLDKFDDDNAPGKPTYSGLVTAFNTPSAIADEESDAYITASNICQKLKAALKGQPELADLADLLDNPQFMFTTISILPFTAVLTTVDKNESTVATDNRVMVWGLNAQGTN